MMPALKEKLQIRSMMFMALVFSSVLMAQERTGDCAMESRSLADMGGDDIAHHTSKMRGELFMQWRYLSRQWWRVWGPDSTTFPTFQRFSDVAGEYHYTAAGCPVPTVKLVVTATLTLEHSPDSGEFNCSTVMAVTKTETQTFRDGEYDVDVGHKFKTVMHNCHQ